jgi:hypothetical protein
MVPTLCVSTTSRVQYCNVHQRVWMQELGQWVACLEPTIDGSPGTEGVCDACTALVRQIFRAQFPALYSSGS